MVTSRNTGGVVVGTTLGACTPIAMARAIRGHIHVPASSSLTTGTIYGCATQTGTYAALQGSTGTAITLTNIDGTIGVYALPAEVCGIPWIKIVGNAAETVTITSDHYRAKS